MKTVVFRVGSIDVVNAVHEKPPKSDPVPKFRETISKKQRNKHSDVTSSVDIEVRMSVVFSSHRKSWYEFT